MSADFIVRDRSADVTGKVVYSVRLIRGRKCRQTHVCASVAEQIREASKLHRATGLHIYSLATPSYVHLASGQLRLFTP